MVSKIVTSKIAEECQWFSSRIKAEECRNYGYDHNAVTTAFGEWRDFMEDNNLTSHEAERLAWYAWAMHGNDEPLPKAISVDEVNELYEETHKNFLT